MITFFLQEIKRCHVVFQVGLQLCQAEVHSRLWWELGAGKVIKNATAALLYFTFINILKFLNETTPL